MPRGNWGILIAALCGLVFVAFGTGAFVTVLAGGQGEHQQAIRGQPSPNQGRDQPQQAAIDRAGLPGFAERAISNPQPKSGTDQEKRDLAAQEATAAFTFWMVAVALAQTLVAGVGIYYIRRTIRQGQEALTLAGETKNETIRIGEAQTRAYLSVVRANIHIGRKRPGPDHPSTDVYLHFHNSGETPAVNVSYHCEAGVSMWRDIDVLPPLETVPYQEFITNIPPGEGSHIKATCYGVLRDWREVQRRWALHTHQTPIGDAPILLIYGVVFHENVFGHTFRSQFGFWLEEQPMPDTPLVGRDDLPTLQARIPTFERIRDRLDHIREPPEE